MKSETASKSTDDLGQGGAIYAGNHVLYLNDCVFTNNYTDADGGAIGTYWGGFFHGAISNCVFVGNTAFGVNQGGGAIMAFNLGTNGLNILDCDFIDNSVVSNKVGNGVAILLHQGDSQVTMRGCRFVGNKSQDTTDASSRKSRTIVQFSKGTNRIIDDCYFEKNIGIPLALSYNSGCVTNCVVAGNEGAAFVSCGAEMTIDGCVFTNNVMDAATYNTGAKGHFRNCLIADNTFSYLLSLHYNYVSAPTRFENCTIAGNSFKYIATVYDNRTDVTEYTAGLAMTNTIFYGNTVTRTSADAIGAKLACSFANVCTDNAVLQDRVTSVGGTYISDDPLFVDAAAGDYRLKRKSPCREAGVWLDWMAGAVDLAGNPRVLDRDGRVSSAALPDIGCYECTERIKGFMLIVR